MLVKIKIKKTLNRLLLNDLVRRVAHTFWQVAGGSLLSGLLVARSSADVKLAVTTALAVGLAAVKNLWVSRKA